MNKRQSSATLTDLKNKIGEVLAVADQHGSVQITSYGRVKYEIRRVFGEEGATSVRQAIKKKKTPKVTVAEDMVMDTPAAPVAVEASAPIETAPVVAEPAPAPSTLSAMEALAAGIFGKREEKNAEPETKQEELPTKEEAMTPKVELPVAKNLWTPNALLPGMQSWNRNSNKEQAWADHARKLVLNN